MSVVIIGTIVGVVGAIGGYLAWLVHSANSVEFAVEQRKVSYKEIARIVANHSDPTVRAEAETHLTEARAHLDTATSLAVAKSAKRSEVLRELLQVDEALHSARVLVLPDKDDDDDNWLTEK